MLNLVSRLICKISRADVICIMETWLDSDITDNEVANPDYKIGQKQTWTKMMMTTDGTPCVCMWGNKCNLPWLDRAH